MKALFFWEQVGGLTLDYRCNPYAGLLARELEKLDIHLELGEYEFEREWLEKNRQEFDVLHLNWLHAFYRRDDLETTVQQYTRFAENLTYARQLGYRIVWTMHNLYPHERPFPEIDRLGRLLMCRLADAVITHCQHAAERLRELFFWQDEVQVIPHGNFIDVYPNEISQQEARAQLGLPQDAFIYIFFGNTRTYKGIHTLIEAFSRAAADDALLLIMSRVTFNVEYAAELQQLAQGEERVRIFSSPYFADEEFQLYLNAADVATLPFSEVLTSGSAITALGFGKPMILPKLGCLPELIDEEIGILYDASDERALDKALVEIRQRDLAAAGRAAKARAQSLDWAGIAARIAAVYRGGEG
jgi:glycosyltransferase involved in cell wall biosynthesis